MYNDIELSEFVENYIQKIYNSIKHGDKKHRKWLADELFKHEKGLTKLLIHVRNDTYMYAKD